MGLGTPFSRGRVQFGNVSKMRIEELSPSQNSNPSCVLHIIPYPWSVQFQSPMYFPSMTIPCLDDADQGRDHLDNSDVHALDEGKNDHWCGF